MGGAPVTNPIALSVGANPIDVVVSAQDGAQQTYSLTVSRALLTPHLTLKLSGLTSGALKLGKRLTAKGTVHATARRRQGHARRAAQARWHLAQGHNTARTDQHQGPPFSGTYRPAQRALTPREGHDRQDEHEHGRHDQMARVPVEVGKHEAHAHRQRRSDPLTSGSTDTDRPAAVPRRT